MEEMVERIIASEQAREGLVITKAWYGKLVVSEESASNGGCGSLDDLMDGVIDVTIPLQCQVKDSKLILTDASKVIESGWLSDLLICILYLSLVVYFIVSLYALRGFLH